MSGSNDEVNHKVRLYGKPASRSDFAKEVTRLMLGNTATNQKPLKVSEVAKALGCSRETVYQYIKLATELKFLETDLEGNAKLPDAPLDEQFQLFNSNHPITNDPLVVEWKKDLLTRKGGGKLATWQTRISSLETVCNSLKINPKMLIISQKQTENYMKNYIEMYRNGNTTQKRTNRKIERTILKLQKICSETGIDNQIIVSIRRKLEEEIEKRKEQRIVNEAYTKSQGVRDFCGFYNITWKRGTGGVMSQKVVGHGKYADVKLSDQQLESATNYIKSKWGIDSDIFRWFWIGIESCARFKALFTMNLDYEKHESPDERKKITYIMKAYESKTKQLKGGMWTKYITKTDTQKSIDILKSRHGIKIYDTPENFSANKFQCDMNKMMTEIFLYLGITNIYFYEHTNHVLRHIGAHYWLEILNYDYGRVALIGGWHTIDELRKSYGEMPAHKLLEGIDKA